MEWIVEIGREYGLFVALVVYVLVDARQRENKFLEREENYITIIRSIKDIREDLKTIKDRLLK